MTKAGDDILQGAREALQIARGEDIGQITHTIITSEIDVKSIRKRTGMTQMAFAQAYALSLSTLKKWEAKIAEPDGAAKAYLTVINAQPEMVRESLQRA